MMTSVKAAALAAMIALTPAAASAITFLPTNQLNAGESSDPSPVTLAANSMTMDSGTLELIGSKPATVEIAVVVSGANRLSDIAVSITLNGETTDLVFTPPVPVMSAPFQTSGSFLTQMVPGDVLELSLTATNTDPTGNSNATFFAVTTAVPLPAAAPLMLAGLAGLYMASRRRQAAAA